MIVLFRFLAVWFDETSPLEDVPGDDVPWTCLGSQTHSSCQMSTNPS